MCFKYVDAFLLTLFKKKVLEMYSVDGDIFFFPKDGSKDSLSRMFILSTRAPSATLVGIL